MMNDAWLDFRNPYSVLHRQARIMEKTNMIKNVKKNSQAESGGNDYAENDISVCQVS